MYVCPEIKLVYLAQPRAASRAIAAFLQSVAVTERVVNHHYIDLDMVERYRADGWRVVTIVRNHFDAIVSWWHHSPYWFNPPKGMNTFDLFVTEFATNRNNEYVVPHRLYWQYQPIATHIVRYENLWSEFSAATGLQPGERERSVYVGQSDRKPYRDYYDAASRKFVEDFYAEELERYGYVF